MSIRRLIFRIDYKVNFAMLDSAGEILQMISGPTEAFWDSYGDSVQQRQVSATFESPAHDLHRQITVEPQAIVFSMETFAGVSALALPKDESYSIAMQIIGKLVERFSVKPVTRMGLRLIYFSKLDKSLAEVKASFRDLIRKSLSETIEDSVGPINDYMLAFDGVGKDKISYHLRYGPHVPGDSAKYFEKLTKHEKAMSVLDACNFVCDSDLFESNFSLANIAPQKWCSALIEKHRKTFSTCESTIITPQGVPHAN